MVDEQRLERLYVEEIGRLQLDDSNWSFLGTSKLGMYYFVVEWKIVISFSCVSFQSGVYQMRSI